MGKELILEGTLEKEDFRRLYKKCKDVRMRERYHAMYLSFEYDWKEISGILDVDYGTLLEWAKAYNREGLHGLERGKPTGRPARLSKEQLSVIKCIMLTPPRMLGMKFSSWTCKSAGKWIRKAFGVTLSAERIRQILHELGFVLLKPSYRYVLADKKERKSFLGSLKKRFRKMTANEELLFIDEATVKQHPGLTNMWGLRGTRAFVNTFGNHPKVCVFGAVNPATGTTLHIKGRKLNASVFVRFLNHIKQNRKCRKVVAVMDNAKTHTAKSVKEFIEKNSSWLEVIWLPRYSPDLNPIEHLWKYMKAVVSNNHLFNSVSEMKKALSDFFSYLRYAKVKIMSLCSMDYLVGEL